MYNINGHKLYDEQDIIAMLYRLSFITESYRDYIKRSIVHGGYGIDTSALLNIITDPVEYNIDYLYSLDSAVTEEFINIMEKYGLA